MNASFAKEDFAFEVESLSGQRVDMGTDSDRRAIMMGLMLHSNGKNLIKQAKYKEAVDVLAIGEEAFSVCDPKIVEMMDNVSILQIDIVWCYFMLRDISCLSVAGVRLDKARKSIDRSYAKNADHANLPLEDQHLQRIIYLRLELLEGVVAYHCGRFEESRKALASAQAKYLQFQVSDEGLTKLMNLGYKGRAAKRALIICSQDIESAANFLIEERTKKARRMEADRQRGQETREQKSYGLTLNGKLVNMECLTVLTSLGIEKRIAAEALRRTENDVQRALDDVTNPDTHCDIQLSIVTRDRTVEELVSMGFRRSQVVAALNQTGSKDDALAILINERSDDPQTPVTATAGASSSRRSESDTPSADRQTQDMVADAEVENEITLGVSADPLSELDVEVIQEGEAISEYMALLDSIERDGSSCKKA
ncbi:NEDD8 ultimate buster 1 [Nymphaea thermarum]|nr:NEDD8 ultimate buster 1 [Nymphaea thermarum]